MQFLMDLAKFTEKILDLKLEVKFIATFYISISEIIVIF